MRDATLDSFIVVDHAEMEDEQMPVEHRDEPPVDEILSFPRQGTTISSSSQLSQSSARTNETPPKLIRRDEPILHS